MAMAAPAVRTGRSTSGRRASNATSSATSNPSPNQAARPMASYRPPATAEPIRPQALAGGALGGNVRESGGSPG